MERRVTGNCHARCGVGENPAIVSKDYLSQFGEIPNFDKLIATIRSREISASIILQAKSQLKAIYKDNADTIEGNCDTMLFLGGKEKTTLKEISESLGKETIDSFNTSQNRGQSESYGLNYQKLGKELKSQDELAVMDGDKCILQLRGVRPFFSDKYDITRHKMYQSLSDEHPEKAFDIGVYVKKRKDMHFEPKAKDKITRFDTHLSVRQAGGSAVKEVIKSDTNDDTEKNVGGTVSEEAENKTESVEAADSFTLF